MGCFEEHCQRHKLKWSNLEMFAHIIKDKSQRYRCEWHIETLWQKLSNKVFEKKKRIDILAMHVALTVSGRNVSAQFKMMITGDVMGSVKM